MYEYDTGEYVHLTVEKVCDDLDIPPADSWGKNVFLAARNSVPGLIVTNDGTTPQPVSGRILAGTLQAAGAYRIQVDYLQDGTSYGTWTADFTVSDAPSEEPTDPTEPPAPARHALAERLAAYLALPGDAHALELADVHLPVVEAFVYGYTRGRGFVTAEPGSITPAWDLAHVIVSAAARLTSNPEQLSSYQTGDYSERPAVLNGWTLPELAILHRYRKRSA